jgi:hypothetical protein
MVVTASAPAPAPEMRAALEALGWRDGLLDGAQEEQLRREGWLLLPDALRADELPALREAFDRIARIDNRADELLLDLLNKEPLFARCLEHPPMLHAIGLVLQWGFKLHSLHGRNPLESTAAQELHSDWPAGEPLRQVLPPDFLICNAAWLLDDMDPGNGATRLVPGSHRRGRRPHDGPGDWFAPQPDEIRITAPAGSLLIFNGHCWHSATPNRDGRPRRTLFSAFCRRHIRQPEGEVQRDLLRLGLRRRLGPGHLYLLDAGD